MLLQIWTDLWIVAIFQAQRKGAEAVFCCPLVPPWGQSSATPGYLIISALVKIDSSCRQPGRCRPGFRSLDTTTKVLTICRDRQRQIQMYYINWSKMKWNWMSLTLIQLSIAKWVLPELTDLMQTHSIPDPCPRTPIQRVTSSSRLLCWATLTLADAQSVHGFLLNQQFGIHRYTHSFVCTSINAPKMGFLFTGRQGYLGSLFFPLFFFPFHFPQSHRSTLHSSLFTLHSITADGSPR